MDAGQSHDRASWSDDPWASSQLGPQASMEDDPWTAENDPWAGIPDDEPWADIGEVHDETTYILGRAPSRTYFSKSFDKDGEPARFVTKVFDSENCMESSQKEWGGCFASHLTAGRRLSS